MSELLKPTLNSKEKYDDDDYKQMLDDCHEEIKIGCLTFSPSQVLEECDPIAYNCGFSDYQEYEDVWECPICDTEHDDEDEATYCCQEETEEEEENV